VKQLTKGDEELVIVAVVQILRELGKDRSLREDRDDFWACDDLWTCISFGPHLGMPMFWV
jgi:hypothetical protein